MPTVFYFLGLIVAMFVGVVIGWAAAVMTGHDENPETLARIQAAIDKVKKIDPDPNNPPKEKKNG